jgi:hypothetical protein
MTYKNMCKNNSEIFGTIEKYKSDNRYLREHNHEWWKKHFLMQLCRTNSCLESSIIKHNTASDIK